MTNELRFGIVGAGYMAKTHSLALRNIGSLLWPSMPRIILRRMADVTEPNASAGASRWGWEESTMDWREITRASDIDVVIVITPNDSHAEISIDAFEHQKHVFCEKPLSSTLAGAEKMAAVAASSGRVNLVNFAYRCWPAIEFARQLIREGEIGEPIHFEGHFFQDYAADPELPFSWRFDQSVSGGGAVADLGSHIFDISCALMGGIASVAAQSRRIYAERLVTGTAQPRPVTVDDLTASLVQFRSGATGSVHASWAATGHKSDLAFSVVGTKGAIEFHWERNNELHFYSSKDDKKTAGFRRIMIGGMHPEAGAFWQAQGQGLGYGEAFVVTARRLIQAVQAGDRQFEPNFAQALHIGRVIEAAKQAAETNSWVPITGPDPFAQRTE
ncbi:MAG TPA: Gfo/Idh/MocA family oxidoreductase [Chthoniobacterales bacterium]